MAVIIDAARYGAHAREVAHAFQVRLIEDAALPPHGAVSFPVGRIVVCAPIIDDTTYAVALHEIGHVVAPRGSLSGSCRPEGFRHELRLTVVEEDAAWTWAHHYALEWTPLMDHVERWGRASYHEALDRLNAAVVQARQPRVTPND